MGNYRLITLLFLLLGIQIVCGCGSGGGSSGSSGDESSMQFYGVEFADTDDYRDLKNKGSVNFVTITATSNWQNILDSAAANRQKVLIHLGWQDNEICQGGEGWTWNGSNWQLNSLGRSFLDFIASYIKNGGKAFLALFTLHEPNNSGHSPNCTTQVQRDLYNLLKQEAAIRGVTGNKFKLFSDIGSTADPDYVSGVCDYCATWYYPNGECSGATWADRVDNCIDRMRKDYNAFRSKSSAAMFVVKAQSFGNSGSYDMPSGSEMEYLGDRMISDLENNYGKAYIFMWYVWEGSYADNLKNSPGGNASYEVLANVYNGQ